MPSNDYSVVVRIDDNLQEYLDIDVDGSTLRIGMDSFVNFRNRHFEVDVMMPDIDAVGLSGGARGIVDDFDLDHAFEVRLSGGSRLEGDFSATHLDVSTSGGARVDLTGSSGSASLSASGGSRIVLEEWETDDADVSMSGGSRSSVNATETLTGSVSGGASVSYVGNASHDQRQSKRRRSRLTAVTRLVFHPDPHPRYRGLPRHVRLPGHDGVSCACPLCMH